MNPKGNVWGFFGTRNTGKTYEALQLSLDFRVGAFKNNPKRIIVFDHSNNSSYKEITKKVTFEDLERPMPKNAVVKLQSDDYDKFSYYCSNYVKNAVVIYDDAGSFFGSGTMTKAQKQLLKTPKNNGLELLLQFHYFGGTEVSPDLLKMMNMLVLKETSDDFNDLPTKVQPRKEIAYLMYDIAVQNTELPENKKWTTRYFDKEEYRVGVRNTEQVEWIDGKKYFPFAQQKLEFNPK